MPHTIRGFLRQAMTGLVVLGAGTVWLNCAGSDTTAPPPNYAQTAYWKLQLNHHAITLNLAAAPYDTVQLVPTPLTPAGTPIATSTAPRFSVIGNDSSVQVSATGLVTGHAVKASVQVVATQTVGGVTLADTAVININKLTTATPQLTTFSIQPVAPDSAKIEVSQSSKTLTAHVLDATGTAIPNVVVHFWSANSTTLPITSTTGVLNSLISPVGQVMIYAETDVYGVSKRDSLLVTVEYPYAQFDLIGAMTPAGSTKPVSYFEVGTITTRVGGVIIFLNESLQPVDVVFDDSIAVHAAPVVQQGLIIKTVYPSSGGGNIPAFQSCPASSVGCETLLTLDTAGVRSRLFPTAGTYPFHSALYGTTGAIVVQ